jgi:hypothetical protein
VRFQPACAPRASTQAFDELHADWSASTEAMARAGVLIECAPLDLVDAATTVRVRGGETLLTDGPAAGIKEQVGGYAVVDCTDLDEALRWAATLPAARDAGERRLRRRSGQRRQAGAKASATASSAMPGRPVASATLRISGCASAS